MPKENILLIIPPNDAEALLITKIGEFMGIPMIRSHQTHGASLDTEKEVMDKIRSGNYEEVIVVEMPGTKTENKIRALPVKLTIIDHHHYTGLDRARGKTGRLLPSSLQQFLKRFRLTDEKLKRLGFDPWLVRSIGYLDQGYAWLLKEKGYTRSEIKAVFHYHDELMASIRNQKNEKRKQLFVEEAWKKRKHWQDFFIVESKADAQLRPRLSRLIVERLNKPTPLIIIEHKRGLIYVQESPHAMALFNHFGGFTFGMDRNWGYRNEKGKKPISLDDVKKFLTK